MDGFFHSLIPSALRASLGVNTLEYMRARALSAILVSITLAGFLAMMLIVVKHVIYNPDLLVHDLVSLAVLLLFVLQTWLFYRFNNYWISALAFTNSYFLVIVVLLLLTGVLLLLLLFLLCSFSVLLLLSDVLLLNRLYIPF